MENQHGIEYYNELQEGYVKLTDLWQLWKLIDPSKGKVKDNLIFRELTLILYNPQTKEYYPRYLCNHTDKEALFKFFNDGNLYIKQSDIV